MTDRRSFFRIAGAGAALAAIADTRAAFAAAIEPLPRRNLAEEYMLGDGVLYFNHASIGTIPRAVHDARVQLLELCETNPHLYMWGGAWDEPREDTRTHAATLFGCAADSVAITHNTTEGFNLLAQGLPLGPDDEILFSSLNHGGAANPWTYHAEARGYRVRRFAFPVADAPTLSADDVVEIYTREISERTRMLVFPHIDNFIGLRHPVGALTRAARAAGVEFVAVDGAQSLGMLPVNVRDFDVDFYSCSPHKWVQAPKGVGLLYVRPEQREKLRALFVSSAMGRGEGTARAFEDYGTRNLAEAITLGIAIDFQNSVDASLAARGTTREAVHRAHWTRFHEAADASPAVHWLSPRDWELSSSLFLIGVDGRPANELSDTLGRDHGAVFRPFRSQGLDGVRISPNVQTTDDEIDTMLRLLGS